MSENSRNGAAVLSSDSHDG